MEREREEIEREWGNGKRMMADSIYGLCRECCENLKKIEEIILDQNRSRGSLTTGVSVTFQFLSFGKVFGFCKLLKQSNVLVNKIARFGVQWLELWSRSKVKRDHSVPIVSLLNIWYYCRKSVLMHDDHWKAALRRALVIYRRLVLYAPLERSSITLCRFG